MQILLSVHYSFGLSKSLHMMDGCELDSGVEGDGFGGGIGARTTCQWTYIDIDDCEIYAYYLLLDEYEVWNRSCKIKVDGRLRFRM